MKATKKEEGIKYYNPTPEIKIKKGLEVIVDYPNLIIKLDYPDFLS